jgi:hypothetical protein
MSYVRQMASFILCSEKWMNSIGNLKGVPLRTHAVTRHCGSVLYGQAIKARPCSSVVIYFCTYYIKYCDVLPESRNIRLSLDNDFAKNFSAATNQSVTSQRLAKLNVFQQ